jgi:hypothetical protein
LQRRRRARCDAGRATRRRSRRARRSGAGRPSGPHPVELQAANPLGHDWDAVMVKVPPVWLNQPSHPMPPPDLPRLTVAMAYPNPVRRDVSKRVVPSVRPAIRDSPGGVLSEPSNVVAIREAHLRPAAVPRGGDVVGADNGVGNPVALVHNTRVSVAVARLVVLLPDVARAPVDNRRDDGEKAA